MKKKQRKNNFYEVKTKTDILNLVKMAEKTGFLAIQVETSGKDPLCDDIVNIWLGTGEDKPVAMINMLDIHLSFREKLGTFLCSNKIIKIFYDSVSDVTFLKKYGIGVGGKTFDVVIALNLLNAGLSSNKRSAGDLMENYLENNYSSFFPIDVKKRSINSEYYNRIALSVKSLFSIRRNLVKKIKFYDIVDTAKLEFDCTGAVVNLSLAGISIDARKMKALWRRGQKKCNDKEGEILDFFSEDVNFHDSVSLKKALNYHRDFRDEGIRFKDTKRSTLKNYTQFPIIKSIMAYRQIKSILDSMSKVLECVNKETGRIHPIYNQMGAVTGRFSCKRPPLQAIPKFKEVRACFVAGQGKKFVIADYSQIELRIAAQISGDKNMIKAFRDGVDFHSLTASIISEKAISDVTDLERKSAKAVNFGILFGMQPKGLVTYAMKNYGVEMSINEATAFQNNFFDEYPDLLDWGDDLIATANSQTKTLGGRIRRWHKSHPPLTELLNTPIQGTAADIIKRALVEVSGRLPRWKALLVACIHDEIILEVDEDKADSVGEQLIEVMENAGSYYLPDVPVVVDMDIDDNWS
ncbi:DNA polymerase [Desulfobacter hydrogenophilus]|nr:DNA polymerase [Desulfobacter hydrogenophilus]NDY74256.1 hypothetical protein [Desulfobacter hydrogenophilus]